jgi:hypothetical protein
MIDLIELEDRIRRLDRINRRFITCISIDNLLLDIFDKLLLNKFMK